MKLAAQLMGITGLFLAPFVSGAQERPDSTGLPGDHFDLRGAMELFKNAPNPEAFEKALNTESNHVNNLDLNGDNKIDYVKVVDRVDDQKNHAIIMRVNTSESELQDVAVIMLEKTGDKRAQLQIVGDKELYGEETVMEPYDESADKKTTGPSSMNVPMHIVVVNVWSWPCVQYIYDPYYDMWVSPWYWGYYPSWWYPWTPYYWNVHYYWAYTHYYHHMYHYVPACTMYGAQTVYQGHRSSSPTVSQHYAPQRANYAANKDKLPVNRKPDPQVVQRAQQKQQVDRKTSTQPIQRQQQPTMNREQQTIDRERQHNRNSNKEPVQRQPQQRQEPVQRQPQRQQPVQRQPQRQPVMRNNPPQRVAPPARSPQPMQRAPQRAPGGMQRGGR